MRLEYFLVAKGSAVDQTSNAVSVFEVIEETIVERLPVSLLQVVAVAAWDFTAEEIGSPHLLTLALHAPDGNETAKWELEIRTTTRRHRTRINLLGLAFDRLGDWVFEVRIDGVAKATHTFSLTAAPGFADPVG